MMNKENVLAQVQEMIGTETQAWMFDEAMVYYGFCSEMDTVSYWMENGSVVYTYINEAEDEEMEVLVDFDITVEHGEDEDIACNDIRINSIEVR